MEITQELLKQHFEYKYGFLYMKKRFPSSGGKQAILGVKMGCKNKAGYWVIWLNKKTHYTHRLIFLFHHGYLPEFIDHIDGDRSNCKIENLRAATRSQNNSNKKPSNKHSIYLGVRKDGNTWFAVIKVKGKHIYKRTNSEQQAAREYNKLAVMYHKEFAHLNIIKVE